MPHVHEKIDFVVTVYIVYGNKVLLVNHKKLGKWLPIGGHVELDEDPDEALFREVKEECGLDIEVLSSRSKVPGLRTKSLLTPNYMDVHPYGDEDHKHVSLTYFALAKTDKVKLEKSAHKDIRWLTLDEINDPKNNMWQTNQFYAR